MANTDTTEWASDFPEVGYDQWRGLAEKALKGADFAKRLVTRTYEGIDIQPLYGQADATDGLARILPDRHGGWEIRQTHRHPDLAVCNKALHVDLENGVDGILLSLNPDGIGGCLIRGLDDLDRLLDGIDLTKVPLALSGGPDFGHYAALMIGLAARRGNDLGAATLSFGADPLGILAGSGQLSQGLDIAYAQMADLATYCLGEAPEAKVMRLNMAPYHEAGASGVQTLACLLATAAEYARQLDAREDMAPTDSLRLMEASLPVDGDLFLTIAQLRAARRLWARFGEACGLSEDQRGLALHAVTARRLLTRRDPWVNILRATATTFGAAVGGADSITALPMDEDFGQPGEFSLRVARNLQSVLREESSLGRVADPAAGSWYVEDLTSHLAEKAWAQFQDIESRGGLLAVLENGSLAGELAETRAARRRNLAKRKDPLTGVSEFPNITEKEVETETVDLAALRTAATDHGTDVTDSVEPGGGAMTVTLAVAAGEGASIATMRGAVSAAATSIEPLPSHRLSEDFEALRDAAEAADPKPSIFLANLGRVAQHTARASFAKNYFEAGGIVALTNEGFGDPDSMAQAFKESGAKIAILCGGDPQYADLVPTHAPALKQAGCTRLFVAGRPGEREEADRAAGVDAFIALGDDLPKILGETLTFLGVIRS
ncbi:methylmalonyl-CoA mutase family protein [Magnetospira sp. QH-2]|uniref:methylmalonyl-CoA mutase family protein n=1 Tax=Magnetospira sp. (strain QH-2) TaxID=1288970 RepID=UPI0003E81906|nr:methylmalonyl-CoA mutase family protein [Magnetospira sp. QH-2]CCQ73373.1 Methylmalonyl-CoA mutase [Magnetospira sp. QH-2]